MMGGLRYDEDGRLRLQPSITKGDYDNWFSSRLDLWLTRRTRQRASPSWWTYRDPSDRGRSVWQRSGPTLQHFIRDDLLEP